MQLPASVRARLVALFVVLSIVQRDAASAPIALPILVSLTEQRDFDSTTNYRLSARALGFTTTRTETLYTPGGTQIPDFGSLEFLTWQELVAESVGEWKFTSTSNTDPTDAEEYRFAVFAPNYGDLNVQFPLVSPPSLSVVTSPLTITWSPPSSSYSGGASQVPGFKTTLLEPGKLEMLFGASYDETARLRFATAQGQDLSAYLSDFVTFPPDPTYAVMPSLSFRRQTAVRYIPADAVPEPSSVALGCMALCAFIPIADPFRRLRPARRQRV